ncbi:MAG: methyl-accepting chemotaxis protein [Acidobacteria bacterium]|nr:methyl-accepting chemotaxis protein [Acidobacteriota bacterium]
MQSKLFVGFLIVAVLVSVINLVIFYVAQQNPQTGLGWFVAIIVGGDVVMGGLAALTLSRYYSRNLKELAIASAALSKGDLTRKVEIPAGDEVGDLANSFNAMLGSMLNVVTEVKSTSQHIFESAQSLSSTAEEMNASTEEISNTVQSIARGAETQADMVSRTQEITRTLAASVEEIATKARAASASSGEAEEKARQGSEYATSAVRKINEVSLRVEKASTAVAGFRERALEINKTVDFISNIAQETHLLALNATIEAARAGEHGRGFAVVAEEVRKLAENARVFAEQISKLAQDINNGSAEVIQTMADSHESAREGRDVVNAAGRSLDEITASVHAVVARVQEISGLTDKQARGAEGLVKAIEEIARIAESNAAGTEEASAATQEQTASMQEMYTSAAQLARTSDTLKDLVSIFKM